MRKRSKPRGTPEIVVEAEQVDDPTDVDVTEIHDDEGNATDAPHESRDLRVVDSGELDTELARESGQTFSLLSHVTNGTLRVPRKHRAQRKFFRFLRRAASDKDLLSAIHRFRDQLILSQIRSETDSGGIVAALSGVQGGEGTSLLSLLLALSLGSCTHRRIAVLDGRFNLQRFGTLSDILGLSRDSVTLKKGSTPVMGYYNKMQPNVYFLKTPGVEEGLEFFSDKELESFLDELRESFDFTIIDMPPLLKETSNLFVAPSVDKLYLVASAGKTRLADLGRCKDLAEDAGAEISGVVLNQQTAPLWSKLFWRDFFF